MGRPDSGWSWVVVAACFYIHFAFFGLFRSSGVIYVALLETYGSTREEASWPFSICNSLFLMTGPLPGVLSKYYSIRVLCLWGSFLASSGIMLCYFAHSIALVAAFFGVIHGLGFGICATLVPVAINQYFRMKRATALGIAFSGGTVSSFLLPAVMEKMLETFGLRGSFLLISGVLFNSLVAAALLRPAPNWTEEKPKYSPVTTENKDPNIGMNGIEKGDHEVVVIPSNKNFSFKDVLLHPMFILISVSMATFFLVLHTYFMVIIDFSCDKGTTETDAIYILSAFSLADLAGRLGLGWVSDRGIIERRKMVMFCAVLIGILNHLFPIATDYSRLIIISALYGTATGCIIPLYFILMAEYLGLERVAFAIGMANFFNGIFIFLRPPMIGYFRDQAGSYDGMFHILGTLAIFSGLVWFLEPLILRHLKKQNQGTINRH